MRERAALLDGTLTIDSAPGLSDHRDRELPGAAAQRSAAGTPSVVLLHTAAADQSGLPTAQAALASRCSVTSGPAMSTHAPSEICEHCALRVGMYEPARIQLADGTILAGSVLAIGESRRGEIARVWHSICVDSETEIPEP